MSFSFIDSTKKVGNSDSPAIDVSAAKLFVAFVHYYPPGGLGATPISDLMGNTWLPLGAYANPNTGNFRGVKGYYVINPVTSAVHTFRTNTSAYGSITVSAFNASLTPILDGSDVGAGQDSGATLQPGSITPATANDLFVSGVTENTSATATIDSGFTVVQVDSGGGAVCSFGHAYKIKSGNSSAENPTWTLGASLQAAMLVAFYEPTGVTFAPGAGSLALSGQVPSLRFSNPARIIFRNRDYA